MKKVFRMVNLICLIVVFGFLFSGCTKEDTYDASGKCGSVYSINMNTGGSIPTWTIRVTMDDGHDYTAIVVVSTSLGERVCF